MLYKLSCDKPFHRFTIDLAAIDIIQYIEDFNSQSFVFMKIGDDNSITYDVTGMPKEIALTHFDDMYSIKNGEPLTHMCG